MVRLFLNKLDFQAYTASARTIENVRIVSEGFGFVKVTTHGNIVKQVFRLLKYIFRKGIVLMVYPKFISPTHYEYLRLRLFIQRLLKFRKTFIFYITDLPVEQLDALEVPMKGNENSVEQRILKHADYLIVFGDEMERILKGKHDLSGAKFVHSKLLDYYIDSAFASTAKDPSKGVSVVYAGGLEKRAMEESILQLPADKTIPLSYHLFGPFGDWSSDIRDDIEYHGSMDFKTIVNAIEDYHFGLILASLSQEMSQYLRVGPTNRFSLYMAAGIPVIVPRNFGYVARIVDDYKVGIVFDDISDIPGLIKEGIKHYDEYLVGVKELQQKVRSGTHFKNALEECMLDIELRIKE